VQVLDLVADGRHRPGHLVTEDAGKATDERPENARTSTDRCRVGDPDQNILVPHRVDGISRSSTSCGRSHHMTRIISVDMVSSVGKLADPLPGDIDGGDISAAGAVHQGADRVMLVAEMRPVQADDDEAGLLPRGQAADLVIQPQATGALDGGCPE